MEKYKPAESNKEIIIINDSSMNVAYSIGDKVFVFLEKSLTSEEKESALLKISKRIGVDINF